MFEIGQKIVCIKTHPEGVVKEGDIYTIIDMKVDCCKDFVLDVGITSHKSVGIAKCSSCGSRFYQSEVWWLHHNRFKPIDDLYNEELNTELEEIFSKQPFEL